MHNRHRHKEIACNQDHQADENRFCCRSTNKAHHHFKGRNGCRQIFKNCARKAREINPETCVRYALPKECQHNHARHNESAISYAVNLRDTAKGLIGFGRLSVPENQPEMLKLWDGMTVEQQARSVTVKADIPQNLVDRLVEMLNSAQSGRGRGARGPAQPL